jgi:hypothetical protein
MKNQDRIKTRPSVPVDEIANTRKLNVVLQ